jgi:hypothetical protein
MPALTAAEHRALAQRRRCERRNALAALDSPLAIRRGAGLDDDQALAVIERPITVAFARLAPR